MILKSFEVEKIKLIKSNLILVYGENQGYKNQIIKELFEKPFNGEIIRLEEYEILNNQEEFISNLMNKSLFDDERLIIISRSSDKILKFINEIRDRDIQTIKIVFNSNQQSTVYFRWSLQFGNNLSILEKQTGYKNTEHVSLLC